MVVFVLIILFFPCTITQLGQFKIGLVKNKVTGYVNLEEPHEPGRYWIGFWKEFIEFPSTLNTIEFSEERPEKGVQHLSVLRSRDKDGKQILLDISIQYILRPANIGKIYKEMLLGYEDIYISELRDALAKAANEFEVEDVWNNYTNIVDLMKGKCDQVLANRFSECWGLQLWGVTMANQFEAKVILTQVKKQAVKTELARKAQSEVRATTAVILAEYKKNITIIQSGGEADKYELEKGAYAEAQANIVDAQAKALKIVREEVCPEFSRNVDDTGNITCTTPWIMTAEQLVEYQKMALLKLHNSSHLIYNLKGGAHPQAMNIQATKNLMYGRARRLLHQEHPELDERRILQLAAAEQDALLKKFPEEQVVVKPAARKGHEL